MINLTIRAIADRVKTPGKNLPSEEIMMEKVKIYWFSSSAALLLILGFFYFDVGNPNTELPEKSNDKNVASTFSEKPVENFSVPPEEDQASKKSEIQHTRAPALTSEEAATFSTWMAAHGYPYKLLGEGGGLSTDSGYENYGQATLRQLAKQGDKLAAMKLAEKILNEDNAVGVPKSEEKTQEALDLLYELSVQGYTASINMMAELMYKKADNIGVQRRLDQPQVNDEYLKKAYEYAYLLDMRGDINSSVRLDLLHQTKKLEPEDEAIARNAAKKMHYEMNERRKTQGLQPLSDGLPSEIQKLREKFISNLLNN